MLGESDRGSFVGPCHWWAFAPLYFVSHEQGERCLFVCSGVIGRMTIPNFRFASSHF